MVKRMETPIKMDDLGIPVFLETPIPRYVSMGFFLLLYRSGKQLSWLAVALAMRLRKDTATLVNNNVSISWKVWDPGFFRGSTIQALGGSYSPLYQHHQKTCFRIPVIGCWPPSQVKILKFQLTLQKGIHLYLEPETTIHKWLFQLDHFKSLHRKWLEITKHPF